MGPGQDLYEWLEARLVLDHPGLRDPAPGGAGVSRARALVGLAVGLVGGFGVGLTGALYGGLVPGLLFGFGTGVAGALAGGLVGTPADLTEAAGPRALLARDRGTFWVVGLAVGLCLWSAGAAVHAPAGGVMNLLGGVLWFAFFQASWGSFAIARSWLALRRRLPWRLMSFLADAHQERGVLRQAGAVYQS